MDAGQLEEGLVYFRAGNHLPEMACAYHRLGRIRESQTALDGLLARDPTGDRLSFAFARVYACLGKTDQAFERLERAREQHLRILEGLPMMAYFQSLHSDPRWAELLRKMNLPVN